MRRGGRKRPTAKGIVYGKRKHQGINQLKFQRNLQRVAEERVGRRFGELELVTNERDAGRQVYEELRR